MVEKQPRLQWVKNEDELIELFKKWKYNEKFINKNLCKTVVRTPTQLIEVLGEEKINKIAIRKSSGLTLVSEADNREAAKPLVKEFEDD